jgi:hypothetical protein
MRGALKRMLARTRSDHPRRDATECRLPLDACCDSHTWARNGLMRATGVSAHRVVRARRQRHRHKQGKRRGAGYDLPVLHDTSFCARDAQ